MVFEYHGFYFMYQTRTSQLFIKQLLLQCFFQQIRHRFIISLSISDICKNLGKGFCMIYFYKMTVFRKRFLISKNVLNLFWCIIMILFLMDNTLYRQTVWLSRKQILKCTMSPEYWKRLWNQEVSDGNR